MKINKIALRNLVIILLFAMSFIACGEDFATIDSDIINEETATNFNTVSEKYPVISYTNRLNPVQTNGLGLNMLGVYDDPTYGRTTSSILTQVSSGLINPSFGENVVLDSVVLTLPFFSRNVGVTEDSIEYELDSVITTGNNFNSIKLSIFENTYFLRDFDPNQDFDTSQSYFSNKSASENEQIGMTDIEAIPIDVIDDLVISDEEILLYDNEENPNITQRLTPRIRIVWDNQDSEDDAVIAYWKNKIIDQEGNSVLSNINNFNDYFRGLYLKAEPNENDKGSLMILNLTQQDANVTLFYSFDSPTTDNEREFSTYTLSFSPTRVNFLENNYNIPFDDGDETNGDSRVFVKGGEGALTAIKLFNGQNADDDDTTDNSFEAWRKQFVNLDEDGNFESSRRLVNEANLVFYVDQELVNGEEPERLYLYNRTNGGPLFDYFDDIQNNTLPQLSVTNHLGVLERDGTDENKGLRYKMKITSHINNILINNTENIELGLAVSGNVNLEGTVPQYDEQNSNTTVPVSSLITPRGTILHGNNSDNEEKRLYLEIFYTCLETDIDCPNN